MVEIINYDSNLWPEIKAILKNRSVVNSEVDFLKIALERNKNEDIIKNTSRYELLRIQKALRPILYAKNIRNRLNEILKPQTQNKKNTQKENLTKNTNLNKEIIQLIKRKLITEDKVNSRLSRWVKEITVWWRKISILKSNKKYNQKETLTQNTNFSNEIIKLIKRKLITEDKVNSRLSRWVKEITVWTRKISILKSNKNRKKNSEISNNNVEVNKNELKNFAAMVKAESLWESLKWKIAVAYVIINRMKKGNKTLNQVLYKRTGKWKSEFSPIDDWRFNKIKKWLNYADIQLIKDVLKLKYPNPISNATFFQTKGIERNRNTWQERAEKSWKLRKVAVIWNHIFRSVV